MSVPSCTQVHFQPYQIAWRHFSNFNSPVRSTKNFLIKFSSIADPCSNPRESWKIKSGLFGKISWSSMSCSPLWIWWLECPRCHSTSNSPLVTHTRFYQAVNYRHQRSVTLHDKVLDFFALGIVNLRGLCSVANTLQERRFTRIRSADDEYSETTNAIKMPFDRYRIQMNLWGHVFNTWGVVWHVCTIHLIEIDHDQGKSLVAGIYSFSWMAKSRKTCG